MAATKTYVAELTAMAMLSTALDDDGVARGQLREVPEAIAAALGLEERVASAAREQAGMRRAIVLGRGFNYATALEWSLKLKEMTYVLADAYSTADFEHGPIAIIDPGFVVHAIAATGPTLPEINVVLGRLREAGARLVVASNSPETLAFADVPLPLPATPEWLSPLSAIIPGQLFAYHLALAKRLDTEKPLKHPQGHQDHLRRRARPGRRRQGRGGAVPRSGAGLPRDPADLYRGPRSGIIASPV